jgi:hypothetical protein
VSTPVAVIDAGAAELPVDASVAADPAPPKEPEPSLDDVAKRLKVPVGSCGDAHCVIDAAYHEDPQAAAEAREVWDKWKIIPGVEDPYVMDGGFRGNVSIVPAVPVNAYRKHLERVSAALADIEQFFGELKAYGAAHGVAASDKMYRWKPRELRFFRSVNRTTPSAYVNGGTSWMIAFNVVGSLNVSVDAARETMMHEIFHLNDPSRTGRPWSETALAPMFDPVVKKCGNSPASIPCLTPYTPNETLVRGGTYYSFQPGNGSTIMEYAAELALRYYRENRAAMRNLTPKPKPFKCGPSENARAWAAMRDEWFGGIDAVPPCP